MCKGEQTIVKNYTMFEATIDTFITISVCVCACVYARVCIRVQYVCVCFHVCMCVRVACVE